MRLLPQVDVGVVGEAFRSFPEILRRVDAENGDWGAVLGLAWRDGAGRIMVNPEAPLLMELDTLPYPAWGPVPSRGGSILRTANSSTAKRECRQSGGSTSMPLMAAR